jgi:hypothetical protein
MKSVFLLAVCGVILMACEQGDDDRLARAQACLDRSTQTTVSECEAMVEGIAGSAAGLIRCSANFITQGFTGSRFANAFKVLKETQTGINSTVAMVSYLVFTVGGNDTARRAAAAIAVTNCTSSGLKGMIMFANFAATATELSVGLTIDPDNPPDPADLQANLAAGDDTTIANSVTAINSVYCSGSSSTNAAFCATIADAADEGSSAAIAAKLRALLGVTP